jgi:hypothetical protein
MALVSNEFHHIVLDFSYFINQDNSIMNYAYLSGMLESELRSLAYDEKFFKMKNHDDRIEYVKKLIADANVKAIEFEKQVSAA